MKVTLDIFSGRANPSWELSEKDARKLIKRLKGKALPSAARVEPQLGFRGYIISAESDDEVASAGLPHAFHIGGRLPEEFISARGIALPAVSDEESEDTALWLLNTAGNAVEDEVLSFVESELKTRKAAKAVAAVEKTVTRRRAKTQKTAACKLRHTRFAPDFWMQPFVQPFNNCYNYAMNFRTDTYAQPGRISGQMYSAFACENVGAAATRDGCTEVCSDEAWEVALVVWPTHDYHWYRKHVNGFWGHKIGGGRVTNLDAFGRIIGGELTPENCARNPYTEFCGFRFPAVGTPVL